MGKQLNGWNSLANLGVCQNTHTHTDIRYNIIDFARMYVNLQMLCQHLEIIILSRKKCSKLSILHERAEICQRSPLRYLLVNETIQCKEGGQVI